MNHASPRPWHPTVRLAIAVAVVVGSVSVASAAVMSIDEPAEVSRQAERLPPLTTEATTDTTTDTTTEPADGLLFPIESEPRCEVFDNYGGFSKAFGSGGHQGVDIGADLGQEVYAVESGALYREFSGRGSGLGWGLLSTTNVKYRYYHLDALAEGLAVGDLVEAGQVIGYVGDTGNASPGGWHLHFEVRPGPAPHRTTIDPVPLLAIPDTCNRY